MPMEIKNEHEKENIWIIIAAYKEEKKIGSVLSSLQQKGYQNIIVVDDGSFDATTSIAENAGVFALRHIVNRGQGAALQTGIDFALQQNAEFIVTFDADGQHQPEEIPLLVAPLAAEEVEACFGSRFLGQEEKSNVPWHRKMLLKGGAFLMWLFYGIAVTDSHNGFRAFSKTAAQKLHITADRMEHASEILEQIAKHNIPYKEIPVTITYTDYSLQKGQSSFAALNILWNMIKNKVLK